MLKTYLKKEGKDGDRDREREREEKIKKVQNVEIYQKNSSSNNGGERLCIMITFTGGKITLREKVLRSRVSLKESSQSLLSE